MARYELVEGSSSKFWEITLAGASFTVRFGRIGTTGQTQTKDWPSAAKATAEHDKLVREKTGKGYTLVDAGAGPTAAPAAAAPAAAAPPEAAEPAPVRSGPAPSAPSSVALAWTPALAAQAAAWRALTTPTVGPVPTRAAAWAAVRDPLDRAASRFDDAVQQGLATSSSLGALARRVRWEWNPQQHPGVDRELDAAAARLVLAFDDPHGRAPHTGTFAALVDLWRAKGGISYALEVFAELLERYTAVATTLGTAWSSPVRVRSVVLHVASPDARAARSGRRDHLLRAAVAVDGRAEALATAERLRAGGHWLVCGMLSSIFLEPSWIDADLRRAADSARGFLLDTHLLHAPDPRALPDLVGRLDAETLCALESTFLTSNASPGWVLDLLDRRREQGLPVAAAYFGRLAVALGDPLTRSFALRSIHALSPVLGAARGSAAVAQGVVAVMDALADETFSKAEDPRPAAIELLRASPEVAAAAVGASTKKWAKTLLPQLARQSAAGSVEEAPAGAVPPALTGKGLDKPPAFWVPEAFARPELTTGGALPRAALDALAQGLKKDDTAVVDAAKAACTPASLAAFSWDLFQAWLQGGADSKDKWAFTALGALGGDDAARKLVPLVRAWPGEAAHARAVTGLEVLARIGSDPALMGLHGIAQKVKFKGLQDKAREKMDEIAARRGFTAEELADRLVPDLELDDDGSKVLDFGARSFRVGFDEALAPFVVDPAGRRLSDLPKPNAKDDAALAGPAVEAWKAMKKDARTLASLQITRLELAMGTARRWSALDFEAFLVRHPLMVHLVRRLVWAVYDGDRAATTFRVAEDRTFASIDDDPFALPPGAVVGAVHRLELSDADAATWSARLADYELAQPFPQLTREVFPLTDAERRASSLERFDGQRVESKKLLGLQSRGWRRGTPQDAGLYHEFGKPITRGLGAWLSFEPGIAVGSMEWGDPVQELRAVDFAPDAPSFGRRPAKARTLGELPPVVVSEVIRDLTLLGTVS